MFRSGVAGVVLAVLMAAPVSAYDPSWPSLQRELYGEQFLTQAGKLISIDAPYRTEDDARAQIAAEVMAPPGRSLQSVTVILDENPMPVSAVFDFSQPVTRFAFDVTMRVNGPTPVHVVAKTTEGQLLVGETFVKTSGLGACSAPPGTDPEEALATLGEISIGISGPDRVASLMSDLTAPKGNADRNVEVGVSHPSHSGMQMDQISLLFIPMHYVESVEVELDGQPFVDVTGSISLSENPRIELSVPGETRSVDVTVTDTDGTVTKAHKSLAGF